MEIEEIIFAVTVFLLVVGVMIFGILMSVKYPYSCDTGKPEVVGDYSVTGFNPDNSRSCAVEDCNAFNRLHPAVNGKSWMCVV